MASLPASRLSSGSEKGSSNIVNACGGICGGCGWNKRRKVRRSREGETRRGRSRGEDWLVLYGCLPRPHLSHLGLFRLVACCSRSSS